MRIAVAGATGTVGTHTAAALRAAGHEVIPLTRRSGVDVITGAGLDEALVGASAVVDLTNLSTLSAAAATSFFTTASANLIAAAERQSVGHVVLLSIVGIDRMPVDYYAGKLAQEAVVAASAVPWTIQRATQFHEFSTQMFASAKVGPLHLAPRGRVQPIAAREVAARLASVAVGPALGRAVDIAGPREEKLDDMIRAWGRRNGRTGWMPSVSLPTKQLSVLRKGLALPGPDAVLGAQTFDEWLAGS